MIAADSITAEQPSGTPRHNLIKDQLLFCIRTFLTSKPLGRVVAETDFKTGERSIRRPDLAYLSMDKWNRIDLDQVPVSVAPDLAIEVISRGETWIVVNRKVKEYLDAGAGEVWLVYPGIFEVQVWDAKLARRLGPGDDLESPTLLPGFSLRVSEIFKELD